MSSGREEIIEKQYYEIKALESKYQKLYDESPVMCRTIDTEGIIRDCNQAYLDNLCYASKGEVIGSSIFEHTPADKIHLKRESFEQWKKTGSVRNKEVWMKRKDGTTFPAMINASNLYDLDGKLIGSNTVITDLTENYKVKAELEKAYLMKQDFIRIAAHELRTPIQPILMCAEAAKRGVIDQHQAWSIIISDARRLKRLADNILDVARIEDGRLSYEFSRNSINDVIEEVVTSAQSAESNKSRLTGSDSVSIEAKLDQDVELSLDRTRMSQAISNIISNSQKFTSQGSIVVRSRLLNKERALEIEIGDTGIGISSDIFPRLFEKFATDASAGSSNSHGTGLGLYITKSIVQAHGGTIHALNDSSRAPGATFVIRLPLPD